MGRWRTTFATLLGQMISGARISRERSKFREHESTLTLYAVQSWIEFCLVFMDFVDNLEDDVFFPCLQQYLEDTPEGVSSWPPSSQA